MKTMFIVPIALP